MYYAVNVSSINKINDENNKTAKQQNRYNCKAMRISVTTINTNMIFVNAWAICDFQYDNRRHNGDDSTETSGGCGI